MFEPTYEVSVKEYKFGETYSRASFTVDPPMSKLILFDKVMIAVYLFVVTSLIATTLIAIDEDYWKDKDHTRSINIYGTVVTVLLPATALALMLML